MSLDLYNAAIKSLAEAADGHRPIAPGDAAATLDNPLCGDRVRVAVTVDDGTLRDVAHDVRGCLLCRASAAVVGRHAPGCSADAVARAAAAFEAMLAGDGDVPDGWEELRAFRPVSGYRSRHGCVLLPFRAIAAAIRGARVCA